MNYGNLKQSIGEPFFSLKIHNANKDEDIYVLTDNGQK